MTLSEVLGTRSPEPRTSPPRQFRGYRLVGSDLGAVAFVLAAIALFSLMSFTGYSEYPKCSANGKPLNLCALFEEAAQETKQQRQKQGCSLETHENWKNIFWLLGGSFSLQLLQAGPLTNWGSSTITPKRTLQHTLWGCSRGDHWLRVSAKKVGLRHYPDENRGLSVVSVAPRSRA